MALPQLPAEYARGLELIDAAHAQDATTTTAPDGTETPYELHYARKMTKWLAQRSPSASPVLQLACRAQHFKRFAPSIFVARESPMLSPQDGNFLAAATP